MSMNQLRIARKLAKIHGWLILLLAMIIVSQVANAQDVNLTWRVVEVSGKAEIRNAVGSVRLASGDKRLAEGDVLRTIGNSRVVLSRGTETIIVAPNTELAVPKRRPGGLGTSLIQRLGTALFKVAPRRFKWN